MKQKLRLWYDKPAPNRGRVSEERTAKDPDWEEWSLPLGCGYMGLNIFGRTDTERIQVTENSLTNPYRAGLNNFAEIELKIMSGIWFWRMPLLMSAMNGTGLHIEESIFAVIRIRFL